MNPIRILRPLTALPPRRITTTTSQQTTTRLRRTMAAAAPKKIDWVVIVPDKAGVHEKRLEVRAQHMEGVKVHVAEGTLKMGGAIFNDIPEGTDPKNFSFYGSTLNVLAETKAEVIEMLRRDIYATSGVWDVDNAQIWPALIALRQP